MQNDNNDNNNDNDKLLQLEERGAENDHTHNNEEAPVLAREDENI